MPVSETVDTENLSENIIGLLDGARWIVGEDNTLTYSFASTVSDFNTYTYQPDDYGVSSVAPLTADERADVREALAQVTALTGLQFEEVNDSASAFGTLRYAHTDSLPQDFAGVGFTPGENKLDGDIWFSQSIDPYDWFELVLHETAHALGLMHPHDGLADLDSTLDGNEWTVMSYNVSAAIPSAASADLYPQTFMWLDIQALQALYGVNETYASGNDVYAFSADERHYLTLWDTGGQDWLDLTGQSADLVIDIRPGSWSDVGTDIQYYNEFGRAAGVRHETLYIPEAVQIENVRAGSGDDILTGNDAANVLRGNAGDDTLSGGGGVDTLSGGSGDDVVEDEGAGGTVWLGTGDDLLTISGNGDYVAGAGAGDDSLTLGTGDDTIYAGMGDDRITDSGGSNEIWLGGGDDRAVLSGAGGSSVGGREGDDTIIGSQSNDTLFGSSGDDSIDGGAGDDIIFGGSGDDTLTAGSGDDTLWGGAGADRFVFTDQSGDNVLNGFSVDDDDTLFLSGFDDVADLLSSAQEQDDGVLIKFSTGGSLLLTGLTLATFEALAASHIILDGQVPEAAYSDAALSDVFMSPLVSDCVPAGGELLPVLAF